MITRIGALLQPIAAGLGDLEPVSVVAGETRPLQEIVEGLAAAEAAVGAVLIAAYGLARVTKRA